MQKMSEHSEMVNSLTRAAEDATELWEHEEAIVGHRGSNDPNRKGSGSATNTYTNTQLPPSRSNRAVHFHSSVDSQEKKHVLRRLAKEAKAKKIGDEEEKKDLTFLNQLVDPNRLAQIAESYSNQIVIHAALFSFFKQNNILNPGLQNALPNLTVEASNLSVMLASAAARIANGDRLVGLRNLRGNFEAGQVYSGKVGAFFTPINSLANDRRGPQNRGGAGGRGL